MESKKNECYQCPDRKINCHATCKKYLAFVKENQKVRDKKTKQKNLDSTSIELSIHRTHTRIRKR